MEDSKKKKINFFTIFKFALIICSIYFLYNSSKENYKNVLENINPNLNSLLFLLILRVVAHTLLSFRMFSFIKHTSNFNLKYINWSNLYFLTGLINASPLWGAGHIVRSYEMKQNNYSHKEYLAMFNFIYFWGILVNSLIIILLLFLFDKNQNIYIFSSVSSLLLISIPFISKKIINFFRKLVQKLKQLNFILKLKFFRYIIDKIISIIGISDKILRLKVFINFSFITILLSFLELLMFFLIFKFLFQFTDVNIVLMFFTLNFLIKKIPSIDGILGLKESLLGLYAQYLGLLFLEGVVISFFMRLLNILSIFINYLIYLFFKKFLDNF